MTNLLKYSTRLSQAKNREKAAASDLKCDLQAQTGKTKTNADTYITHSMRFVMDVKYLRRCEKAKSKIKTNGFEYRKIPKISPGAYIFQRPFLRGLFLEELIFGGAYLRRDICISKSIGLAL